MLQFYRYFYLIKIPLKHPEKKFSQSRSPEKGQASLLVQESNQNNI